MSAAPENVRTTIVLNQPEIPDLAAIGNQINTFDAIADDLTGQAARAVISSEGTFATGTDFLTLSKTNGDELEKLRKALKRPIDLYAQTIQDIFLPILNKFSAASLEMKKKMLAYRSEQDRIAREEQDRVRKEQEAAALARAAELEKQGNQVAAEAVLNMATAPLPAPQRTEARRGAFGGKASVRETWTADVINKREFLKAVLDGSINFNLDDITIGQAALNKLASALKVSCERNGVKVYPNATMNLRS